MKNIKINLTAIGIVMLAFISTINAQDQSTKKTDEIANETIQLDYVFACTLPTAELLERKAELSKEVFSKIKAIKEIEAGYQLHFDDTEGMALRVADFMLAENSCCPFLNFDLSLLAFQKGIVLGITGPPEQTKNFMKNYFEQMGVAHLVVSKGSGE